MASLSILFSTVDKVSISLLTVGELWQVMFGSELVSSFVVVCF